MRRFNKNSTYSIKEMAEAIHEDSGRSTVHSLRGTISDYIKRNEYQASNCQKHSRVFSGVVAQNVYDYYCNKNTRKLDKQISVEDISNKVTSKKRRGLSVDLPWNSPANDIYRGLSHKLNVSCSSLICEAASLLADKYGYYSDEYEAMDYEELQITIRGLYPFSSYLQKYPLEALMNADGDRLRTILRKLRIGGINDGN